MENVNLKKRVFGSSTYQKAIDNSFKELISPPQLEEPTTVTIDDFFNLYDQLFFDIPVSGSINSHTYLVERSQDYIGGGVLDAEKQALIEEINSLRQQLIDLNQGFNNINTSV
jgi:hypothetical protein